MALLERTGEPGDVGMDSNRLQRLTTHFATYVDDGRLPGFQIAVARHGSVVFAESYGKRDIATGAPVEADTIFRAYSMTKPITSVAAMILFEEGKLSLDDPVSKFIPAFADTRVYLRGPGTSPATTPQLTPMTVLHLLTHTAGLTYGFAFANGIDHLYRQAGFEWGSPAGATLAECCDVWAGIPLVFQPGSEWNYSVATDVLGRVVEVVSGQTLDQFFQDRILTPLGMNDTAFWVDGDRVDRLASLYLASPGTVAAQRKAVHGGSFGARPPEAPRFLSGGGGLHTTTYDYLRFAEMLRGGGQLGGTRILGPRTVRFMASNHLPNNADLTDFGRPIFAETSYDGVGFGLGFSVVLDPVKNRTPGSAGDFGWGGAASTAFWVDPVEDMSVVFMTQLLPSSVHPIRPELKRLVHAALID